MKNGNDKKNARIMSFRKAIGSISAVILLSACDSDDFVLEKSPPLPTYDATVTTTSQGYPHITAENWGSLGFGYGVTYASQNFCNLMGLITAANGEAAKYPDINPSASPAFQSQAAPALAQDFVMKLVNNEETLEERWLQTQPQNITDLLQGTVDGLNHFLENLAGDTLPGECTGAEWVRPITMLDMVKVYNRWTTFQSSQVLQPLLIAASAPTQSTQTFKTTATSKKPITSEALLERLHFLGENEPGFSWINERYAVGSNAYAIGSNASTNDSGVLLGNPHWFWSGFDRLDFKHLTIPGELDVAGISAPGWPLAMVGFNESMAWTATVSTGQRYTLYELTLSENNNMAYMYDGEERPIEPVTVTAEARQEDGSVVEQSHTFYMTHFGPVVDLGIVDPSLGGWPTAFGTILVMKDALLHKSDIIDTRIGLNLATSVEEVKDVFADGSLEFVNTLAVDRDGNALYIDSSTMPNVDRALLSNCVNGQLSQILTGTGLFFTLDGSDSNCEWGANKGTPSEWLTGADVPSLETRDYAANSNDSYWLANPDQLLTGFSPIVGQENAEVTLRTRQAFVQAEKRIQGDDTLGEPGFSVDNIRELMYQNDSLGVELLLPSVLAACNANPDWSLYAADPQSAITACEVLANWDQRFNVDSVGAHIFNAMWTVMTRDETFNALWEIPFDPTDPVNTPTNMRQDENTYEYFRQALAGGVGFLSLFAIPLDAPWGEVQYALRNGERIPLHGGNVDYMFSVILSAPTATERYSDIILGNSYVQAVGWDSVTSNCPNAFAQLAPSQSTDPNSPHFDDGTMLYSEKGWLDIPFCADDIAADRQSETVYSVVIPLR